MSLNDKQSRIHLERSGPWIGVAGIFVLLWIAIASSQYAGWGAVLFVLLLIPSAILVARFSQTNPRRAAFVPAGSFVVWLVITVIGLNFWGWETDPEPSSSAKRVLAAQCADKFENLRQTMGENGNPGRPGRKLTLDWDTTNARATELSTKAAAGDCPKTFDSIRDRFDGIDNLIYGEAEFDMVRALELAEVDLVHAKTTRTYDPLPEKLRRAFERLRLHAPKSNAELQKELDTVDSTDPMDKAASKKSLAELRSAAQANDEFEISQRALGVIGDYELSEE